MWAGLMHARRGMFGAAIRLSPPGWSPKWRDYNQPMSGDELRIGAHTFTSRLFTGTGKYADFDVMREALSASGSQLVTVALRRVNLSDTGEPSLLDFIDTDAMTILPNTAGCKTVDEAVRVAEMARALGMTDLIKLEVIDDPETLLPDPQGTVEATRILAKKGFTVMPYTNQDPITARKLEDAGAACVMPLASPIGSGQGMISWKWIELIIALAGVPVVVDAGLGVPSDAALAMEMGAGAVLVNTAIAKAADPVKMAEGFKLAVQAGRLGFQAGRIPVQSYASPSSPVAGVVR